MSGLARVAQLSSSRDRRCMYERDWLPLLGLVNSGTVNFPEYFVGGVGGWDVPDVDSHGE
uniref:Uncharacterized protein n=1 Tax=Anguilla anguilla TaxID=7936 RepID=A0A0E9TUI4_ANGAN